MIKLTAFFEAKQPKAAEKVKIPSAAYGRNFSDRCREMHNEALVVLSDLEANSKGNKEYQASATQLKAAMTQLQKAAAAFKKVS